MQRCLIFCSPSDAEATEATFRRSHATHVAATKATEAFHRLGTFVHELEHMDTSTGNRRRAPRPRTSPPRAAPPPPAPPPRGGGGRAPAAALALSGLGGAAARGALELALRASSVPRGLAPFAALFAARGKATRVAASLRDVAMRRLEAQAPEMQLSFFDGAIRLTQNITQIERKVMVKLFWSDSPKMASVQDRPKGGARKVVVATLVQPELVEWREINPKQCAALRLGPSRTDPRTDSRAATPLC